jgi:hypothetical protein
MVCSIIEKKFRHSIVKKEVRPTSTTPTTRWDTGDRKYLP